MKVLAGTSNSKLCEDIARQLKLKLVNTNIKRFADGEVYVEINENIRGNSIFVVQSTSNPANDNLIAVVGPCIGKESYEVKIDFYERFISQNQKYEEFFKKIADEKYIFDLRGFVNNEISDSNIKNIENIEMDTFSEKEFFYSYRRTFLNKEKDYGRCISVILMT